MKLSNYLSIKTKLILVSFLSIILVYFLISCFFIENDPVIFLLQSLLKIYLDISGKAANFFLRIMNSEAIILDQKIIFHSITDYVLKNQDIIDNWPTYLLYKKWTAFLLVLFWATLSPVRKKLAYTGILALTHFLSVISGLVMIAGIGPVVVDPSSLSELRPHTMGAIAMFCLMAVWIKSSKTDLRESLKRIKIKADLPEKRINEFLVVLFIYFILRNLIVPYFNFYFYINFLLKTTQGIALTFGYASEIDRAYLRGDGGALFMAKWCLGFITMFVFAAMVYMTGTNKRTTWLYILSGLVLLHIFNIIRLVVLFIFVQNNDTQLAIDHHDIYNIIVYALIFILWVIWFEKFTNVKRIVKK